MSSDAFRNARGDYEEAFEHIQHTLAATPEEVAEMASECAKIGDALGCSAGQAARTLVHMAIVYGDDDETEKRT